MANGISSHNSNDSSSEDPLEVRLRLPAGVNGPGFVKVLVGTSTKASYELSPRHARVLYALALHWSSQEGDDFEVEERGWISVEELLDVIDRWTDYRPTEGAVRRYIAAVIQKHRAAVQAVSCSAHRPIIERRRQLGARVDPSVRVEVICLGRRPGEAAA